MAFMASRVARTARRVAPLALEAYRRWDRLSDAEKERYKERIRDTVKRGRTAIDERRRGGGGGPSGPAPGGGPSRR